MEELLELGSRFSDIIGVWSVNDRTTFDKAVRLIRRNPNVDISEYLTYFNNRINQQAVA